MTIYKEFRTNSSTENSDSKSDLNYQSPIKNRRALLKGASLLTGAIASSLLAKASTAGNVGDWTSTGSIVPLGEGRPATVGQGAVAEMLRNETRRLHLYNDHTGDEVNVVYYVGGIYINDALKKLNHLMRDRRANIATQIDTTLYDQLCLLRETVGLERPMHVLSGYRTAKTNATLRRNSSGVAKFSLHMEGRAADIYIPGFKVGELQKVAHSLGAGGVGLYSNSNFVHVDTGTVRSWGA